ncbi:MAG: hypothetical protein Q7T26_03995 [Dehalococcoidia bacterium]|nr:hypothetical protein [Dehalococcoidia bacterium]
MKDHIHTFARQKSGLLRCWECGQEFTDIQALSYRRQILSAYACVVCGEPAAYQIGEKTLCDFHVREQVDKGVAEVMRRKTKQEKPAKE